MFFFSIVIIALLPFFSQALEHNLAMTNSTKYSTWMASSIMSRNQGIAPSGSSSLEKSLLLRSGVLQTALVCIIQQYPSGTSTPSFKTYLSDSIDSNAPYLLNATVDTQYPLDYLSLGNPLIYTVQQTKNTTSNETYNEALDALRLSIDLRSRNQFQGLWYYTYPNWSYLDGMFSLAPFYAYYTSLFSTSPNATSTAVADNLLQLDLLWEKSRRNDTPPGLLVHGYDASKTAVWADPVNGASPHVWGRSLGWYAAGMVDTLELLPVNRSSDAWTGLRARFEVLMNGVVSAVDPATGAWWQVMDQPGREGNYVESSSSALFIFALLKGARLGFLGRDDAKIGKYATNYVDAATRAYEYVVDNFVINNGNGTLGYNGTVSVCSLNSTATYEYYINQPLEYNSVLGAGSFVLASLEYENLKADL